MGYAELVQEAVNEEVQAGQVQLGAELAVEGQGTPVEGGEQVEEALGTLKDLVKNFLCWFQA